LFEMNVRRCFWHDFFDHHDARLVTTVMCSWDTNWMWAINPPVSGLRAERTSLLSLGDDECRFACWRPTIPSPATPTSSSSASSTSKNPTDGVVAPQTSPIRRGRTRAKSGTLGQGVLDLLGSSCGAVFLSDPLRQLGGGTAWWANLVTGIVSLTVAGVARAEVKASPPRHTPSSSPSPVHQRGIRSGHDQAGADTNGLHDGDGALRSCSRTDKVSAQGAVAVPQHGVPREERHA
jgi:L-2-amino-thiazoline-4-carboxylic acid hydrolase